MQRLEQEHKAVVITTTPTVPYTLHLAGGVTQRMESAADFPVGAKTKVLGIEEPTVNATIVVPGDYVGGWQGLDWLWGLRRVGGKDWTGCGGCDVWVARSGACVEGRGGGKAGGRWRWGLGGGGGLQ